MAGYVTLFKYTQKGIDDIKTFRQQMKQAREMFEKMGVRMIGTWMTMGEYDGIIVFDAPDDQTAATLLLASGMRGTATTQTMRAFSEDEVATIVGRLP
jgi:uncharacterized protein with GYD domain